MTAGYWNRPALLFIRCALWIRSYDITWIMSYCKIRDETLWMYAHAVTPITVSTLISNWFQTDCSIEIFHSKCSIDSWMSVNKKTVEWVLYFPLVHSLMLGLRLQHVTSRISAKLLMKYMLWNNILCWWKFRSTKYSQPNSDSWYYAYYVCFLVHFWKTTVFTTVGSDWLNVHWHLYDSLWRVYRHVQIMLVALVVGLDFESLLDRLYVFWH
jgi:hypothetical protein